MKKGILIIFSLLVIVGLVAILNKQKVEPFYLEDRYYEAGAFIEIGSNELEELIKNKESFAIFIYQPACTTSSEFSELLTEFETVYQMTFYQIAFSDIKGSNLEKYIQYYPSFAIYKDGKIVDYLKADDDEDTTRYQLFDSFASWFTEYVLLKNEANYDDTDTSSDIKQENMLKDVVLENVTYDENKVNIYFFWGNGCPHCEEQFSFLESIEEEYGQYYQLYTFETWYDDENADLMQRFATTMGDSTRGVPYTIIGNKSFKGFSASSEQAFLDAIMTQYQNSYDVYFESRNG